MDRLKDSVEAILFSSARPVTLGQLKQALPAATDTSLREAIDHIRGACAGRAFELMEIAGGWQLQTRPEHHEAVLAFRKTRMERKFTPATLDTLAIVAYRQPITRAEVESIRGAASGEILRALMEAGMARTTGRSEAPGAPLLYGTTPKFLETFGLKGLSDLPKPEELK